MVFAEAQHLEFPKIASHSKIRYPSVNLFQFIQVTPYTPFLSLSTQHSVLTLTFLISVGPMDDHYFDPSRAKFVLENEFEIHKDIILEKISKNILRGLNPGPQ